MDEAARQQAIEEAAKAAASGGRAYSGELYEYSKFLVKLSVPEEVVEMLWGVANQVHQLTCLDKNGIEFLQLSVDNLFTLIRMSIPEFRYTYEVDIKLQQMETLFYSMIMRSSEGGFERKMQATQIRQLFSYSQDEQQRPKTGVLGRLFGGKQR